MKKAYQTPYVEKIDFQYRNQVVAQSGIGTGTCSQDMVQVSLSGCTDVGTGVWSTPHA